MSNPKWILFLFLFLSISGLICGVAEMSYLGPYAEQGLWDAFTQAHTVTFSVPGIGQFGFPVLDWGSAITSLWDMLFWNYAVFNSGGALETTAQFFLRVVSAAFALSLVWTFLAHIPIVGRGSS